MIKFPEFILVGMKIPSENDNDIHFISAERLIELYDLPRKHCICVDSQDDYKIDINPYQITLYPRISGDYKDHLNYMMLQWSKCREN